MDSPAEALFVQVGLKKELINYICNDCGISTIKQFKYLDLGDLYDDMEKNVIYKVPNNEKLLLKEVERKAQKISSSDSVRINFEDGIDKIINNLNVPPSILQDIPESIKTVRDLKYYFSFLSENNDEGDEEKGKDNKKKDKEDENNDEKEEPPKKEEILEEKKGKIITKIAIKRINDYFGQVVDSSKDGISLDDSIIR